MANEIGGNQQEVIAKLIEAYEFQKGKTILTARKADVEKFEGFVTILTRMYMDALEENQNITETVHIEYEAQLKSKDLVIQELQEKNNSLTEIKDVAVYECNAAKKENVELFECIASLRKELAEEIDKFKAIISDKEELNSTLLEANREYKVKNESMNETVAMANEIQVLGAELERKVSKLEFENSKLEQKIIDIEMDKQAKLEEANKQAQFDKEKELFDLEKKYEEQIQKLKEEQQIKIEELKKQGLAESNSYQKKCLELLDRLK